VTGTQPRRHRPSAERPDRPTPNDSQPAQQPRSRRPPDYLVVIAASDWVKEHYPAAGANLLDALRTGHDRDPEPDLEAEP
jgi:hypothetical protein